MLLVDIVLTPTTDLQEASKVPLFICCGRSAKLRTRTGTSLCLASTNVFSTSRPDCVKEIFSGSSKYHRSWLSFRLLIAAGISTFDQGGIERDMLAKQRWHTSFSDLEVHCRGISSSPMWIVPAFRSMRLWCCWRKSRPRIHSSVMSATHSLWGRWQPPMVMSLSQIPWIGAVCCSLVGCSSHYRTVLTHPDAPGWCCCQCLPWYDTATQLLIPW